MRTPLVECYEDLEDHSGKRERTMAPLCSPVWRGTPSRDATALSIGSSMGESLGEATRSARNSRRGFVARHRLGRLAEQ